MTKKTSSKSPRKQRRSIHKSPLHTHKSMLRCRLDEFLREEYGLRNIVIKKGDLVRVMRGQFRDTEGKVIRVDYQKVRVYLDSATTTKADGKEVQVPVHPSNLMLVKLELDDERKAILEDRMVQIAEGE
ncbi:MAG: 50S ribosomal protein L24 [Candidatus Thorarchaeota archaeon]|nr:MAG: 50S ribosomal protein L24 [Candidatus Thorarchaeota archaeon]